MDAPSKNDAALDDDENTLLMKSFDESGSDIPEEDRPSQAHVRRWSSPVALACLGAAVGLAFIVAIWLALRSAGHAPKAETEAAIDADFVVDSTPRTRIYNWTVTRINASPVGVNKSMVVVNGQSPGPLIEANHHDRIIVRSRIPLSTP